MKHIYKICSGEFTLQITHICPVKILPQTGDINKKTKKNVQYKLGTAAIFSCSIEADPMPEVKWEINGQVVDQR